MAHEGCSDILGLASLAGDQDAEFETAVDVEDFVSIFEAIQPAPITILQEQSSEVACTLVCIYPAG